MQQRPSHEMNLPRKFLRMCRRACCRSKVADSSGADLSGAKLLMGTLVLRRVLRREVLGRGEAAGRPAAAPLGRLACWPTRP